MDPLNCSIIDSHHHLWKVGKFDYPWMPKDSDSILCRDYLPVDLKLNMDQCGVDKAIVVQADLSIGESDWLIEMAEQHDFIAGVVAWVDLQSEQVADDIERLMQSGQLVGVRHPVHDEVQDDWILQEKSIRGLKVLASMGIPYDLLIRPQHLKCIVELMVLVPDLKVVINHLAKPLIADEVMEPWATDLAEVAQMPGVYCKLSGMVTEADFTKWSNLQDEAIVIDHIVKDIKPYVEVVHRTFGIDRLMWGSDWPVCNLAASYQKVYNALLACVGELSEHEQSALMGLNAARFYKIET